MRNNTKKGFTLVELLVVIAILAILATVSVVGYTSFIERADVSADQNEVAQLNHFLAAYQADRTSPIFNTTVNEWNARFVTKQILELSGIGDLASRSGKHGYNVYFDLEKQEYVLAKDEDIKNGDGTYAPSPLMSILGHAAADQGDHLGTALNKRFFIASTTGNAFAEFVDAFYNLGVNDKGEFVGFDGNDVEEWRSGAYNLGTAFDVVKNFANNAAVANGNDAYAPVEGANEYLIYPDNSQKQVPNNSVIKTEAGNWVVDEGKAPISGDKLPVPDDAEHIPVENLGDTVTLITNQTPEEVASKIVSGKKDAEAGATEGTTAQIKVQVDNGDIINIGTQVKVEIDINGVEITVEVNVVIPDITNPELNIECSYENPLKSFDILVSDGDNIKNIYGEDGSLTNSGYVAWELDSFELFLDTKGKNPTLPATDTDMTWTANSDAVTFEGNTVKFDKTKTPADEIVITGNNGKGVTQTFTIKLGKATAATVELAGKFLNTTPTIYLVHGGKTNVHEIELGTLTYNEAGKNLTLDTKLDVTYTGTGLTEENNVLTTSGNGNGALTIKVGKYFTYTVNVVVFDKSSLPISTVDNITVLAQGSATAPIKISDLFSAKDAAKIPADAEVRFTVIDADDQYVEFDRDYVSYVKNASGKAITSLAWSDTAGFYFSDVSGEDTIAISVFSKDGTRISDDVIVKVISGDNARTWADINKEIKTNVVLLKTIVFPADAQLVISGGTFYGNDFTLDVRAAKKDAAEHIIKLTNATLDGVNIVGKVYSTFTYQNHYASGTVDSTSIVVANNATIRNCYIANGRAPVRVIGDTTVEDSVIFGGKYANIDVAKGKLTLAGDVTTINQIYEGTIGGGIVCDMTKETNYVTITNDCNLVQYNFVPKSSGSALPTVTVTMKILTYEATISVPMGSMVTQFVNDPTNYGNWTYEKKDDKGNVIESYLNAGIVYLVATGKSPTGFTIENVVKGMSSDNRSSGKVPSGYEMATYTETYRPGPDQLNYYLYANAYVYSPVAKENGADSKFVSTWFKDAINEEFMEKYLPTNYVSGAMK